MNPSEILTASGARSQLTHVEDFLRENSRFAVFFQCVGIPVLFYFFLEGVSLLNRDFFVTVKHYNTSNIDQSQVGGVFLRRHGVRQGQGAANNVNNAAQARRPIQQRRQTFSWALLAVIAFGMKILSQVFPSFILTSPIILPVSDSLSIWSKI